MIKRCRPACDEYGGHQQTPPVESQSEVRAMAKTAASTTSKAAISPRMPATTIQTLARKREVIFSVISTCLLWRVLLVAILLTVSIARIRMPSRLHWKVVGYSWSAHV